MRIKKIAVLMLAVVLSTSIMTGCIGNSNKKSNKLTVAVSIIPEQTFAKAVCGDLADVVVMVPPGFSPENYEPTPKEMQKLSDSTVYFSIGVPVEKDKILPKLAKSTTLVSLEKEVVKTYPDLKLGNERDPHIWLSPKRAIIIVNKIAEEMGKIDPNNKSTYEKNAADYVKQLESVDSDIKEALKDVKNRKFVVYHPAFGYLANDYNLEMFALEDEGKEATASHLKEMIDLAKKEKIKAIFYQAEVDSSQSKAYAEEIGGKTIKLEPLAADYINNLKAMAKVMSEVME